jgi:hypothetical protein
MIHPTPAKVLLATTLQPLVVQLSGSLARGAKLIDQFLHHEPTPQQMATFERELSTLLREVGRRIVAWVLNHLESDDPDEVPSRLWFKGQAYRRRRKHRTSLATLFGPVVVWRRLYEPLMPGLRAIHPLELTLGMEAGVATPALAERVGRWAADHTQRQVLEMLQHDHGVHWSCATLRKLLSSLSAGMATVSVLDRRGKRVGTVYLGQMPESGQTTLTTHMTALIQDILKQVDAQSLRLVYVSDDGYHPSDYYHTVLKTMPDPKRPWCPLTWIRIVDY